MRLWERKIYKMNELAISEDDVRLKIANIEKLQIQNYCIKSYGTKSVIK